VISALNEVLHDDDNFDEEDLVVHDDDDDGGIEKWLMYCKAVQQSLYALRGQSMIFVA